VRWTFTGISPLLITARNGRFLHSSSTTRPNHHKLPLRQKHITMPPQSTSTPDSEFEYDVFISYSSRDKDWVRGDLLKRIENAGLKAFIDFRDFTPGAPSINECERGVLKSRKTLLVLTPNYIPSEWAEIESIMVQTLGPANRDLRMIPLLKTDCERPLRIAALTYLDFRNGGDFDLSWHQLLTALGAPPESKTEREPEREQWFFAHTYAMPPNFTGRIQEKRMLSDWLGDANHPLLILRALGGFGKSALAWHWLKHEVKPSLWPRVVWWSFYENDSSFGNFLVETLDYLSHRKLEPERLSAKGALHALLQTLRSPGTLLVLDGFERELRAFSGLEAAYQGDQTESERRGRHPHKNNERDSERDCVSPVAETFLRAICTLPEIRAKILLTTRLRPTAVETRNGDLFEGCREEELSQMSRADAVDFFHARGIRGGRAEIQAACEAYGFHPLSLRLLAGWIAKDLQQRGDIAAAKRLDVSGELVQRQHHVLEQAYEILTEAQKKLLGQIACFRGPVRYEALVAVTHPVGTRSTASHFSPSTDSNIQDLIERGWIHRDLKENRFDLHPIVRRYAYDRLTSSERTASHTQLRDYFAAVPKPEKVRTLDDLAPIIELYHHTVRAGHYDEAFALFHDRLSQAIYYQLGAYQLHIDLMRALFPDGEDHNPRLKNERAQSFTLNNLATSYSMSGQPHPAVPLHKASNAIDEKRGDKKNLAIGLSALAWAQIPTGSFRGAQSNLHRSMALSRELRDEFREAILHQDWDVCSPIVDFGWNRKMSYPMR
jgi:hypothetical protein